MKPKKCEVCGDLICDGMRFVNAKMVCKKCFNKLKESNRSPRTRNGFLRSLLN